MRYLTQGLTYQRDVSLEEQAIEPIGESKSDYEAVGEVAKKLGLYKEYTDGMTVKEKIKKWL